MMRSAIAALLLGACPSSLPADGPKAADSSPEAVVRAALAALKDGRTDEYARLVDPDDLQKFKTAMLAAGQSADRAGNGKAILTMFADAAKSVGDLAKLGDAQFFGAFLRGPLSAHADQKRVLKGSEIQVLGQVAEGAAAVHVVYRVTASDEGMKVAVVQVMSLGKTKLGWRVRANGEEVLAAGLRAALGEPATEAAGVKGKPAKPPEGEWELQDSVWKGMRVPFDPKSGEVFRLRLTPTTWTSFVPAAKREDKYTAAFSEAGGVFRVDLHVDEPGKEERGIWKVEGDTLTICMGLPGEPRPADYTCPVGSKRYLFVLKRVKKD
jgi:uncharacterized protein (TIGR03067 family)